MSKLVKMFLAPRNMLDYEHVIKGQKLHFMHIIPAKFDQMLEIYS